MDSAESTAGLKVATDTMIPFGEFEMVAIHGGGPGGQHVNRSATRIALTWNIRNSSAINDSQRTRLLDRLASRIDCNGEIRIVAGEFRSQQQNRRAAIERLRLLVSRALIVPRTRKPTRPSRAAVQERLDDKRRRSLAKQQRRSSFDD